MNTNLTNQSTETNQAELPGKKQDFEFFATSPKNLERILATEISQIGGNSVRTAGAGVRFYGTLETGYRVCLWSRVANHILLPIFKGPVTSPESLYECIQGIDWSEHMDVDQTLAVDFFTAQSDITHSQFGALKVKDAVVDQFRDKYDRRPSVERDTPDLRINVYLHRNQARVSIDLSGTSLHRRNYREEDVKAPLKENIAAALLLAGKWPEIADRNGSFHDPMCGSGTFLIEAAMISSDTAPGINRTYFGFLGWKRHDATSWKEVVDEAMERSERGMNNMPSITGSDKQYQSVQSARANVKLAGFENKIKIDTVDLMNMSRAFSSSSVPSHDANARKGLLVFNPPYGKRLSTEGQSRQLYEAIGNQLRKYYPDWSAGILTPDADAAQRARVSFENKLQVSNGGIDCEFLFARSIVGDKYATPSQTAKNSPAQSSRQADGNATSSVTDRTDESPWKKRSDETTANSIANAKPAAPELSDMEKALQHAVAEDNPMFANRLAKNLKKMAKWAKQKSVQSYRLYDSDMPEYSVAIDIYHCDNPSSRRSADVDAENSRPAGFNVVIQEYQAPASIDQAKAASRLKTILRDVPLVLQCNPEQVHLKIRQRQRGTSQYEKKNSRGQQWITDEFGCRLIVNFQDYLDTGLFLDHRKVRQHIQHQASGKRFLNLFCYTGTATVHAVRGGSTGSMSVDLSNRYLDWARQNLALHTNQENQANQANQDHQFEQADVMTWLRDTRETFDLILLDPPTFSNSTQMNGDWEVQRDHVDCVKLAMKRLSKDGSLIFSTNFRKFRFDPEVFPEFECEDRTDWSIDADFARNRKIHQCWFIKHRS